MKFIFILLNTLGLLSNPSSNHIDLKNGDLIFQESCSGNVGNAIKSVTNSIDNYNFTHVGIVWMNNKDTMVIEATHPCVKIKPLGEYLKPKDEKCYPKSVVGRLKPELIHLIPNAINEAIRLVGKEYDYAFILDNDKYYCSELIYEILKKSNDNTPVFQLNTMTFKDKITGEFSAEWISYFQKLDTRIPEGEMGINPGAMSKSEVIDILFEYN